MRLQPDHFWGYFEWLFLRGGLLNGFLMTVGLSVLGFVISYLIAMARNGPSEGFYSVSKIISDFFRIDLPGTSLQRIYAIARLAFKEAIRRRVVAVVAIFVILMMFAGWYLDRRADHPARLYISFVLASTNILILMLGLFLSAFSLPNEIKSKTIYSIVTKPVRPTEIVIGRVVGFGAIGTMILLCLGLLSYVFVIRGLDHRHDVKTVSTDGRKAVTSLDAFHKHEVTLGPEGIGSTDEQKGHKHIVRREQVGGKEVLVVGPPIGDLTARIPIYGSLRFTNREGKVGDGLNVGYESEYQKFVEGASLMSAIWTFDQVTPSNFPNGLELEATIAAFRTFKADIVTGVQGAIALRNPDDTTIESERMQFTVKEYQVDQKQIPIKVRGLKNGQPAELDLFRDLAPQGKLEVIVRCLDRGQYLGMAPADLALRAGERSFGWNFFKGYVGIWLQMMIIICFGVMFSTFLSGPVAMIATATCLCLGYFGFAIVDVATGKQAGGGPIESLIRIPAQTGVMTDLDLGNKNVEAVVKFVDSIIMRSLAAVVMGLPNLGILETVDFVAYGINIFGGLLGRHITTAMGYFVLTTIVGYVFLKTREMAA